MLVAKSHDSEGTDVQITGGGTADEGTAVQGPRWSLRV